jgi:hypothetical protein
MTNRVKNRLLVLLTYCMLFQILNGYFPKTEFKTLEHPVGLIHYQIQDIFTADTLSSGVAVINRGLSFRQDSYQAVNAGTVRLISLREVSALFAPGLG